MKKILLLATILSAFLFQFQTNSKLTLAQFPHKEPIAPIISMFGEVHDSYEVQKMFEISYDDLWAETKQNLKWIVEAFEQYNLPEPLHIFIEAMVCEPSHIGYNPKCTDFLPMLHTTLCSINSNQHIIENFDFRNVQTITINSFREEVMRLRKDIPSLKEPYIHIAFNDFFAEIDRCILKTKHLCAQNSSYININYADMIYKIERNVESYKRTLIDYDIPFDKSIITLSESLYNGENVKITSTDILKTLVLNPLRNISSPLVDLALCVKIIAAYNKGERILVFAGEGHIRRVMELLKQNGYCTNYFYVSSIQNKPESRKLFLQAFKHPAFKCETIDCTMR